MRNVLLEMASDLPEAMFCAAVVGLFIACVAVWSGWFTGVL